MIPILVNSQTGYDKTQAYQLGDVILIQHYIILFNLQQTVLQSVGRNTNKTLGL